VINYAERRVAVAGRPVVLTATAYGLLFEPFANADLVVTHEQLLQRIWGPGNSGEAGLAGTAVQRLRRKSGDDAHNPRYIFTEPRVGYRMEKPSSNLSDASCRGIARGCPFAAAHLTMPGTTGKERATCPHR